MSGSTAHRQVVVTGAAGYIGSHAALALLDGGHRVLGIDNFFRGNRTAVEVLKAVGGERFQFLEADILERERLTQAFRDFRAEIVMHFAALAYVGESMHEPLRYWLNNTAGTLSLRAAMVAAGVSKLVFSSTCATYGVPDAANLPITESCPQRPINPYGRSKLASEQVLLDELEVPAGSALEVAILRYFNVAGCDPRGRLGEDHRPETHLVPICLEVALGLRPHLDILGEDYSTPDGTCVRDYVHVSDLVDAHLTAMAHLRPGRAFIANVGIGRGFSVREVLDACRRVTGHAIPHRAAARRPGDPPSLYADASHIRRTLGWSPRFTSIDETVATAWAWRRAHPRGY